MKTPVLFCLVLAWSLTALPAKAQQRLDGIAVGQLAPEVAMPGPDGDTLRLSSLRGHIVLLDFWASWCRPCRMENPRVRATWQAYKDTIFTDASGFRVFSVSLDRKGGGEAWKKAIMQDSLEWPWHVSAVKSGINTAANTYQVRYIPTNVLLDAQGKVIGVDLHGEALSAALNARLERDPAKIFQWKKELERARRKQGRTERRALRNKRK